MKKIFQMIKELDKATSIRTVLQILVYLNQIVVVLGTSPLGESVAYQWVTFVLTLIFTALSYWKNNDWTGMAKMSTKIFNILKDGTVTEEEMQEFIESKTKS